MTSVCPVSQKKDIKRQKDRLEALKKEAEAEKARAKEAARERVLADFERGQLGLGANVSGSVISTSSSEGVSISLSRGFRHAIVWDVTLRRRRRKNEYGFLQVCFLVLHTQRLTRPEDLPHHGLLRRITCATVAPLRSCNVLIHVPPPSTSVCTIRNMKTNIYAPARGTKRKFSFDTSLAEQKAQEAEEDALRQIEREQALALKSKLPDFWLPSLTPTYSSSGPPISLDDVKVVTTCRGGVESHALA